MESTIGKAFSRTFGRKSSAPAPKPTTPTAASPPVSPQPAAASLPPQKQVFIDTHPNTLAKGGHGKEYSTGNGQNSLMSPDSIPSPTLQATVSPSDSVVPLSSEKPTAPPVHFATNGNGDVAGATSPRMTHTTHMRESTAMSTTSTDGEMTPVGDNHGLNPANILLNRLLSYRAIVKNLQQYFIEIAMVEQGTSKAMQRASTLIYVPFKDGHQFVGQGGLQDVCIGVRDSAKTRSEQHAAAAQFVEETIVKNLRRLKQDIKSKVKALKADSSLYNMKVFKEREASQERIGQLAKSIGLLEKVGGGHQAADVHSDPYLIHLALKRQLARQVHEENLFARGLLQCQEQIHTFECHVVKEIKQILTAFAQHQLGHASAGFSQSWAQTEMALQVLQEDTEWRHFMDKNKGSLFPSDLVDANPEELNYPCKESPYVVPIKTAYLSRQSSVLKNWKDGFFVLTLAGWLHVFSSSKDLGTDSVPERSIYLPTAILGPHSDSAQKQHVFSLDGKGMGGLLHRDAQTFTVRAHSREEMLDWWSEIAKHTQAALVTQVTAGTNLGHSSSTIIRPGPKSPELAHATALNQEASPPHERPNDKAEVPGTPVADHTVPLPAVPIADHAVPLPAAPVAVTTSTTTNSTLPSTAVNATNDQTTFLPERAPIQQDQHPMKRQNTGSTVSLNTPEPV